MYHWIMKYHKRHLLPCRKKSLSAADDEGYQTGVGRTMSRKGAGQEQNTSPAEAGAGQEQEQGSSSAGTGQE